MSHDDVTHCPDCVDDMENGWFCPGTAEACACHRPLSLNVEDKGETKDKFGR